MRWLASLPKPVLTPYSVSPWASRSCRQRRLLDAPSGRRRQAELFDLALQDAVGVGEGEVVAGQFEGCVGAGCAAHAHHDRHNNSSWRSRIGFRYSEAGGMGSNGAP